MFREAKDISDMGKARMVTVDELNKKVGRSISFKQKMFICPDCCEYVGFVYCTDKSSYFMHEKSDGTRKCEIYIQRMNNNQIYFPYERAGLPLYLIRRGGNFSLNIGFYPIDKQTLQIAAANKLSLEIYTNKEYKITTRYINEESFSSNTTAFIEIDKISSKYKLKFSNGNLPVEIKEKWNSEIEGLEGNGAFFKFHENGGIKIRKSEEITLNTDYYLVCKCDPARFVDEIICDKVGEINFSSGYWETLVLDVYKIRFTAITQRNIFFCLERGVLLVYKSPELNPIWPPCIMKEQLLIYEDKQTAKFLFKTSEKAEKYVIIHPDSKAYLNDLDEYNAIASISVDNDEKLVSIGRQNAPFAFAVAVRHQKNDAFNCQIIAEDAKGNNYTAGEYVKLPYNNRIRIATNFIGIIYIYDNDALEKVIPVNDSVLIDEIRYGRTIDVFHGLDLVFELKFKKVTKCKSKSDDESVFKEITSYVGNNIPTPISLKYILPKLIDYPMLSIYVRKAIKKGSINKAAMHKIELFIRSTRRE